MQRNWSKGQIDAALDQLRKELASEMKGAFKGMEYWETHTTPPIEGETKPDTTDTGEIKIRWK